jgi:hypothetical protein
MHVKMANIFGDRHSPTERCCFIAQAEIFLICMEELSRQIDHSRRQNRRSGSVWPL